MTDSNFTTETEPTTYPVAGDGSVFTEGVLEQIHTHLHELNAKVDHLLEHMHHPLHGTITIDSPPKTEAGNDGTTSNA